MVGKKPDLQKMNLLALRGVEFAMLHARSCTHALHAARADDRTSAHAILVGQRAFQHIADNLHIAVAMRAKTLTRLDSVIIDDAQRTKLGMFRIVIVRKRKAVPGIQPAMVGMAPLLGAT